MVNLAQYVTTTQYSQDVTTQQKNDTESTHFHKSKDGYYISMLLLVGRQIYPHYRHFEVDFPTMGAVVKPHYGFLTVGLFFKRGNITLANICCENNAYCISECITFVA